MHASGIIALRHLLMNNATPRRHPLNIARRDRPAIPETVAMLDGPSQNISNGLDSAMRMPRKPRQIILRHVIAKIVEQQKRIELRSEERRVGKECRSRW